MKIADGMHIDNSAAPNGGICRFKEHQGLVYKKLLGESTVIRNNIKDL
jgi:hypothetical protein